MHIYVLCPECTSLHERWSLAQIQNLGEFLDRCSQNQYVTEGQKQIQQDLKNTNDEKQRDQSLGQG